MDFRPVRRLIVDKLHDRTTYGVAAVVGTLISATDEHKQYTLFVRRSGYAGRIALWHDADRRKMYTAYV